MNTARSRYVSSTLIFVHLFAAFSGFSAETPPLIEAIKSGDTTTLNTLLTSNPSLDARDDDGNTALHWAAIHGRDDLVRELMRLGATVDATNRLGVTPLIHAVGNVDSVRALIEAGADVNHLSSSTVRGISVQLSPLLAAVTYPESSRVVEQLLQAGANPRPGTGPPDGVLRRAALAGDLATVDLLLAAGLKPALLHPAVAGGNLEIVQRFLDAGADLNVKQGGAGSALNAALIFQRRDIASLLLEQGVDLNIPAPAGNARHDTPSIVLAAYSETGDTSTARIMIEQGVDLNASSSRGETALDWAHVWRNQELVELLQQAGAETGNYHQREKDIPNREARQISGIDGR